MLINDDTVCHGMQTVLLEVAGEVKVYNKGLWSRANQLVFSDNRNSNLAIN